MTNIGKKIAVPENRRINLEIELPKDTPIGEVNVNISITPISQRKPKRTIESFYGIFKDSPIFEGDPVEIQRKMRDEW
jgi:hypothetical protein